MPLIVQLLIGDFSLSYEQSKSQFAIWAILAAVSNFDAVHQSFTERLKLMLFTEPLGNQNIILGPPVTKHVVSFVVGLSVSF